MRVEDEGVRDPAQAALRLVVVDADRLVGQVAAGHDEGRVDLTPPAPTPRAVLLGSTPQQVCFDLNRAAGTTLVVVTHDEALAARVDRRLPLDAGRLTEHG